MGACIDERKLWERTQSNAALAQINERDGIWVFEELAVIDGNNVVSCGTWGMCFIKLKNLAGKIEAWMGITHLVGVGGGMVQRNAAERGDQTGSGDCNLIIRSASRFPLHSNNQNRISSTALISPGQATQMVYHLIPPLLPHTLIVWCHVIIIMHQLSSISVIVFIAL